MPVILSTQETEIRRIMVQSQPWENSSCDTILKKLNTTRPGGATQVVKHLPFKHGALSSSPSTAKKI
jgi:hypothetical protein